MQHTEHKIHSTENNTEQHTEQDTETNNAQPKRTEQNTAQNTENSTEQPQHRCSTYDLHKYSFDFYHEYIAINNSNTIEVYTISKD